jgi:hypothetical protein
MQSQMQLEIPGLGDFTKIAEAMNKKDEALLWEAAKNAKSQAQFFERLRNECGMTSFSTGSKMQHLVRHHSAMIMVPLVLAPESALLVGNPEAMKAINHQVVQWISEWFEYQSEITIFNSPVAYEEICVWSPLDMRAKLEQLSSISTSSTFSLPDASFNLPENAPRLAFVVAAVQRAAEFPTLPPVDALTDASFKGRLAGAIQVLAASKESVDVSVFVPDYASEALLAGLLFWVQRLHETVGIHRWDAVPAGKDVVILQLELGEDARKTSPIVLRAHQLGIGGVQKVLDYVAKTGTGLLGASVDSPAPTSMH